jgi:hypothetical protein
MASEQNPIAQLLESFDSLDAEAIAGLFAPGVRMLVVDGRRATGQAEAQDLLADFQSVLRRGHHEITSTWHVDDVWIAEVSADYELRDRHELRAVPRVFIVRAGPEGITELRVYGAHEHPLREHMAHDDDEGWIGGRPMLPL